MCFLKTPIHTIGMIIFNQAIFCYLAMYFLIRSLVSILRSCFSLLFIPLHPRPDQIIVSRSMRRRRSSLKKVSIVSIPPPQTTYSSLNIPHRQMSRSNDIITCSANCAPVMFWHSADTVSFTSLRISGTTMSWRGNYSEFIWLSFPPGHLSAVPGTQ